MITTPLFWMTNTAENECGYRGKIQSDAYYSEEYNTTMDFFMGGNGNIGNWTIDYDREPCDISSTPFHPVVSERFKEIILSKGIPVDFYKVDVSINNIRSRNNFYFPVPEMLDILDKRSRRVIVSDNGSKKPGWIEDFSHFKSSIHYDKMLARTWIQQPKSFGLIWIVSDELRRKISENRLSGFVFHVAKASADN